MKILPFYAALLAILFVALSFRTLGLRRNLKIALGDAGNEKMRRAIRAHSNFAEYVPICLLLLFLAEERAAYPLLVHALGICLLVGRSSHAFGVSQIQENFIFRVVGMALTFTSLISAALYLLFSYAR